MATSLMLVKYKTAWKQSLVIADWSGSLQSEI